MFHINPDAQTGQMQIPLSATDLNSSASMTTAFMSRVGLGLCPAAHHSVTAENPSNSGWQSQVGQRPPPSPPQNSVLPPPILFMMPASPLPRPTPQALPLRFRVDIRLRLIPAVFHAFAVETGYFIAAETVMRAESVSLEENAPAASESAFESHGHYQLGLPVLKRLVGCRWWFPYRVTDPGLLSARYPGPIMGFTATQATCSTVQQSLLGHPLNVTVSSRPRTRTRNPDSLCDWSQCDAGD